MRRFFPLIISLSVTAFAAILAGYLAESLDASFWQGMELGKAALEPEYCEFNHMDAFVRQPVNSWSNFCYLFYGVWLVTWGVQDVLRRANANPVKRFPAMTIWVGLMQIGLCFGSFFFHASLTKTGQHWDMAFTYGLGLSLAFGGAYRLAVSWGMKEGFGPKAVFLGLSVASCVLFFLIKWWLNGRIVLPIVMLTGVTLVMLVYLRERKKLNGWMLLTGFFFLMAAAVFRSLDLAKVGCDPLGWMQLHACWHLTTGLSAFIFLAFLRNEKP